MPWAWVAAFSEACWQQVPLWGDCGLHSIREQTRLGEQGLGEIWGLLPMTVLLISTMWGAFEGPLNHRVNLWQTGLNSSKIWSLHFHGRESMCTCGMVRSEGHYTLATVWWWWRDQVRQRGTRGAGFVTCSEKAPWSGSVPPTAFSPVLTSDQGLLNSRLFCIHVLNGNYGCFTSCASSFSLSLEIALSPQLENLFNC